jgi:glycosyltransferase involved in cell wall biosynthesis
MSNVERPVRVIVVIPRYAPVFGGAENQCRLLNRHLVLSERVAVVSVLTSRILPSFPGREAIDGITVRRLGGAGLGRWTWYRFFLITGAYLLARRNHYDVIHCHATSVIGFVVTVVGWLTGKPVVLKLSANGELLRTFPGQDRGRREGVWARCHRLIASFTVRHAYTVALNAQGLEELQTVGARHALIIPNGVDTAVFRPSSIKERAAARATLDLPDSAVVFAFTGRFVLLKGLDLLLPAFRSLLTTHGADAVRLLLVGSGELQEESVAAALAPDRLGAEVTRGVHVHTPTADVRPFLFASDVFVMPSRHEGLSNAVLEAIACGMVCVLSDIPPHRELKQQSAGHPVFLFPSGDTEALGAALEQAYVAVQAMRAARQPVRSGLGAPFTIGTVAERYVDLLRDIAMSKASR